MDITKLNTIELSLILVINLILLFFLIYSFNSNEIIFYIALLFFLVTLFFVGKQLFYPSNTKIDYHDDYHHETEGIIEYFQDGFIIDTELRGKLKFQWDDIIKITVSKNKFFSNAELSLIVETSKDNFVIHESNDGFYQFSLRIYTFLKNVDRNWQKQIYEAPKNQNTIIIYQKPDN